MKNIKDNDIKDDSNYEKLIICQCPRCLIKFKKRIFLYNSPKPNQKFKCYCANCKKIINEIHDIEYDDGLLMELKKYGRIKSC